MSLPVFSRPLLLSWLWSHFRNRFLLLMVSVCWVSVLTLAMPWLLLQLWQEVQLPAAPAALMMLYGIVFSLGSSLRLASCCYLAQGVRLKLQTCRVEALLSAYQPEAEAELASDWQHISVVAQFMEQSLAQLLRNLLLLLGALLVMLMLSWQATLLMVVLLFFGLTPFMVALLQYRLRTRAADDYLGQYRSWLMAMARHQLPLWYHSRQTFALTHFHQAQNQVSSFETASWRWRVLLTFLGFFSASLVLALMVYFFYQLALLPLAGSELFLLIAWAFLMASTLASLSDLLAQAVRAEQALKTLLCQPSVHLPPEQPLHGDFKALHVQDASVLIEGKALLQAISLTVLAGEKVAIVGLSGSGKSTLLKLIAGLLPPSSGALSWNGQAGDWQAALSYCACLFDYPAFMPMGLLDNIAMGQSPADLEVLCQRLGLSWQAMQGTQPSQGEKERLHLLRLVHLQRPLWLLDEVGRHLDPHTQENVYDWLRQQPVTVLLVTHQLAFIAKSERVLWLHEGRLRQSGRHEDLLADPLYRAVLATAGGQHES